MSQCGGSVYCYIVSAVISLCFVPSVTGLSIFTKAGWPSCYISRSNNQDVPGLFNICYSSRLTVPAYNSDNSSYYIYCSVEHECCYNDGYPACCPTRTGFRDNEVLGLVFGCVAFVLIILGVALCLANKHCRKDETEGL